MKPIIIKAITISDAWFQLLYNLEEYGFRYRIDKGSYEQQERVEYDFAVAHIVRPWEEPRLPVIPENLTLPPPATEEYIYDYFIKYLLNPIKQDYEDYTYAERIWSHDQVLKVIDMLKKTPNTNHAVLRVSQPSDIDLDDPPCLLHIQYKLRDNKLHSYPYFRSWDLYAGFPTNLAGIQLLNDYIVSEVGCNYGEMIATSSALHIYDHHEDVVKIRLCKSK